MPTAAQEFMSSHSLTPCSQRKYNRDWSKLPTDLLADILCCLDDNELVRCTIICKSWNNCVVNVCIPNIYASSPLGELLCMTKCNFTWYLTHLAETPFTRHGRLVCSFEAFSRVLPSEPYKLTFRGCCNGLFLHRQDSNQQYCVFNPATGQVVEIPVCREVYTRCCVSLAFDPCSSRHFKLVCFLTILRSFKFYIYSSETSKWDVHIIRFDNYDVEHEYVKRTVYVNSILYSLFEPGVLLSIDVGHMKVCSINLPFRIRNNVGFIGVSRNHLCYSNRDFFYMFVWRLEGNSDAPKWVLMHKIHIELLISVPSIGSKYRDSEFFMPYALHPTSDVIFIGTPKTIVAYDPHRREVIGTHLMREYELVEGQFRVYPYVRCLASLKPTNMENASRCLTHMTFMEKMYKGLEDVRSNSQMGIREKDT